MSQQAKTTIRFADDVSPLARHAIAAVIEREGGFVNNPDDKGRETKYGISKRWYPELNIHDLTIDQAAEIYHQKYWLKNECQNLAPCFALLVFDCAVNQGGLFARKALQQALKVKPDGEIGPRTHGAALTAECSAAGCVTVAIQFTRIRCRHYTDLVQIDYSQAVFIEGWIDRALQVLLDSVELPLVYSNI